MNSNSVWIVAYVWIPNTCISVSHCWGVQRHIHDRGIRPTDYYALYAYEDFRRAIVNKVTNIWLTSIAQKVQTSAPFIIFSSRTVYSKGNAILPFRTYKRRQHAASFNGESETYFLPTVLQKQIKKIQNI
jgi:hypothetical protein